MPKVMIEGMEMPKSCTYCRFAISKDGDFWFCVAEHPPFMIPFKEERAKLNNRPSWCPLQEVKE